MTPHSKKCESRSHLAADCEVDNKSWLLHSAGVEVQKGGIDIFLITGYEVGFPLYSLAA